MDTLTQIPEWVISANCTPKAPSTQLPVPPSAPLIQISCHVPQELQTYQDGFGVFSISLGMNNEF